MKTTIKNRAQLQRIIDILGDNAARIRRIEEESKSLHHAAEAWCRENPDEAFAGGGMFLEDETGKYVYRLEKSTPALRVMSHLSVADVVGKLGANDETKAYVKFTYDADAIKADFGGTEAKRQKVEAFGLYFTKPDPRLKIGLKE